MKLLMVGCSHHNAPVNVRERLAFNATQLPHALAQLRNQFPDAETVLLSTCNRVELYAAAEHPGGCPTHHQVVDFLARFHGLSAADIFDDLLERTGEDAVRHLFTVAASLDSMVVGEAQILAQVKQAYELATSHASTGPLTHSAFQTALRVAKRVATETAINQRRVSIPSVAVADFAKQIFERFDDKRILVLGAGEMAEETLRYLVHEGAREITLVNRSAERARALAVEFNGRAEPWERRFELLAESDFAIGAVTATEPIVSRADFQKLEAHRFQRPLFLLDLAVPRNFDPALGECLGVYLYSLDDLQAACERNRLAREREWPQAEYIIEEETARFMADLNHRATGPTIKRLKESAGELAREELARLLPKLPELGDKGRDELRRAFDRLVNKLLHPPLESLRDEAQSGAPQGLLEALKRLFKLAD